MLEGKIAIVTGGSRGIGRAVTEAFVREGASVMICGRAEAPLRETAERLGPDRVVWKAMDVADEDAASALVSETLDRFGRLDVLVNNAGLTRDMFLLRLKPEDFDAVVAANLRGSFLCLKAAARPMMRQKGGRILNMTSVAAEAGNMGQAAYGAAKAGIVGLTRTAARELARYGVTVNAISPGLIDTDMLAGIERSVLDGLLRSAPLGRLGRPEEVAHLAVFLASEKAAFITGQTLRVDGGLLA